jgi:hypothetical protein
MALKAVKDQVVPEPLRRKRAELAKQRKALQRQGADTPAAKEELEGVQQQLADTRDTLQSLGAPYPPVLGG